MAMFSYADMIRAYAAQGWVLSHTAGETLMTSPLVTVDSGEEDPHCHALDAVVGQAKLHIRDTYCQHSCAQSDDGPEKSVWQYCTHFPLGSDTNEAPAQVIHLDDEA